MAPHSGAIGVPDSDRRGGHLGWDRLCAAVMAILAAISMTD